MRNFKKVLAGVLSASMLLGTSAVAFGDNLQSGGESGNGKLEGTVNTEVFSVTLPTVETGALNFTLDPEQLIKATDAAAYSGKKFTSGATLYFPNSGDNKVMGSDANGADVTYDYSSNSDKMVVVNQSSISVDVAVSATLSSGGGLALSSDGTFSGTTAAIYLALTDGTSTSAITSGGTAKLSKTMAAAADGAYKKVYKSDGTYAYMLSDGTATSLFSTYNFWLTGSANANGDWSNYASIAPVLNVTWVVTPHQDYNLTATTTALTWSDRTQDFEINADLTGLSATSINDVGFVYNGTVFGTTGSWDNERTLTTSSFVTISGNKITLKSSVSQFIPAGTTLYIRFNSATATPKTITIN